MTEVKQIKYGFDDIGNRKWTAAGGNEWGSNLRYANYSANSFNQYTQRTVPGATDVLGTANASATVTVNNRPSYRKGDYFRKEYQVTNTTGPVWGFLTNLAVMSNGAQSDLVTNGICRLMLPKTPGMFYHGADNRGLIVNNKWDSDN